MVGTMNVTIHQLTIFRAIVVSGSITKAARALRMTQPAISQQLYKLEELLGVQLIVRNKTGSAILTPAGEYWYKAGGELLTRLSTIEITHQERYVHSGLKIKLGVTPSMIGHFTRSAARIAQETAKNVNFELVTGANSDSVATKLRMQMLDFGVIAETAILEDALSFRTIHLYQDRLVWAVPKAVTNQELRAALDSSFINENLNSILNRYIDISQHSVGRSISKDWYNNNLPNSLETFSAPSFKAAVDLVAEGLATSIVVLSLLPNLSQDILDKVRFFELKDYKVNIILAIRKHLMTHKSYSDYYLALSKYCNEEYWPMMDSFVIEEFSKILDPKLSHKNKVTYDLASK